MTSEESTTPDLVEPVRQATEASNRHDIDALMSLFATDAVFVGSMGTFHGATAIRGFFQDMVVSFFEDVHAEIEDVLELGNGVGFAVLTLVGRPTGSSGEVRNRFGLAGALENGLIVHYETSPDIDEARAAAERLAEERG